MARWRNHLSFANVISVIALFVALGGASYAISSDDDGPAKSKAKKAERAQDQGERRGPPPWAPAHGWRCKEAGHDPGSPAFRACIKDRTR